MAVFTKKSPRSNHTVPKTVVANPIAAKPTKPNITTPKIAIIGSGVSGLTCAYYLKDSHAVTMFESNDYLGGHVNTLDVTVTERSPFKNPFKPSTEKVAIDTGFIVFNERTYPNFIRLLDELNVPFQKAEMSFSVKNTYINFEYNGHTLNSLFSQRRHVLSPRFWQFVQQILRFNREIKSLLANFRQADKMQQAALSEQTLGDYLDSHDYGELFKTNYLVPMVSAIWSMGMDDAKRFPLLFFAQFFDNHGLLDVVNRPQWFTLVGGSKQYVNALITRLAAAGTTLYINTPVQSVTRGKDGVSIEFIHQGKCQTQVFDDVVFACHADVARRLLADITETESAILAAFEYTDNEAVLHTDTQVLPKKPLAWASWNYAIDKPTARVAEQKPILTYHMNILERLTAKHNYLVTLNTPINEAHVIKHVDYRHPVYDNKMTNAQKRWHEISAKRHTHFCGAYWFNGFHEDGVKSGLRVCQSLGVDIDILVTTNTTAATTAAQIKRLSKPSNKPSKPSAKFTVSKLPSHADKKRSVLQRRQVTATTNHAFCQNLAHDGLCNTPQR
ncbi:FAD-dependent oxidoreductase [Moraxella osloensis]|nr:FAD-dependent oxidoreductase [Moraxella osloensis]MDI4480079.1 FAD-dependent oxidoreductase [Moraxella osloensis]